MWVKVEKEEMEKALSMIKSKYRIDDTVAELIADVFFILKGKEVTEEGKKLVEKINEFFRENEEILRVILESELPDDYLIRISALIILSLKGGKKGDAYGMIQEVINKYHEQKKTAYVLYKYSGVFISPQKLEKIPNVKDIVRGLKIIEGSIGSNTKINGIYPGFEGLDFTQNFYEANRNEKALALIDDDILIYKLLNGFKKYPGYSKGFPSVYVLIDSSESMSALNRLTTAKAIALAVVKNSLINKYKVRVGFFNEALREIIELKTQESLERFLKIEAEGVTDIEYSLSQFIEIAEPASSVLLITDALDEISGNIITKLKAKRIILNVIQLFGIYNERLVIITKSTGGLYIVVNNLKELKEKIII